MPSAPITENSSTRNPILTNQPPNMTTNPSRSLTRNPRLLPVTPLSGILPFLPAVISKSQQNHQPLKPLFLINWVKTVSSWQRRIILTAIFVYTVVVLAIKLLTARRQPLPLPWLKPMQLQSRKRKRRKHKKAKQPSGLCTAKGLHYSFLCHYKGSPP